MHLAVKVSKTGELLLEFISQSIHLWHLSGTFISLGRELTASSGYLLHLQQGQLTGTGLHLITNPIYPTRVWAAPGPAQMRALKFCPITSRYSTAGSPDYKYMRDKPIFAVGGEEPGISRLLSVAVELGVLSSWL